MSLTNILNTESKDSRKYKNPELKKIDYEEIAVNQLNKFPLTELMELQNQIRKDGLLTPLTVYLNSDGTYTLYSGHRRLAAMLPLLHSGELPPKINCIVINKPEDIVSEKETIYLANKNRPPLKESELRECVFDLIEVWNMKPKEKRIGRMRDYIASYLNISARSLQKYINEYKEIHGILEENTFTKDEQGVIDALEKQREEKKKKQQAERKIKSALNKNGELASQLEDYGLDLYNSYCTVNGKEMSLASSLQMLEEVTKEVLKLLDHI